MWSDECHLRNNNKEDKGSVVVIWDEDDYLKEAEGQLSCKEIYEEVTDDPIPYKYYKYSYVTGNNLVKRWYRY